MRYQRNFDKVSFTKTHFPHTHRDIGKLFNVSRRETLAKRMNVNTLRRTAALFEFKRAKRVHLIKILVHFIIDIAA